MLERAIGEGKILIVGEAPSRGDFNAGKPFVGRTGKELDQMLHEAGILRTECSLTFTASIPYPGWETKRFFEKYTKAYQTPKEPVRQDIEALHALIEKLSPNLIISLGDLSLWALTGEVGITKWRGSVLETPAGVKVLPTYSPDIIARKFDWRFIAVQDFRRALRESAFSGVQMPAYNFIIRPNFQEVMETLEGLLKRADNGIVK